MKPSLKDQETWTHAIIRAATVVKDGHGKNKDNKENGRSTSKARTPKLYARSREKCNLIFQSKLTEIV